MGNNGTMQKKIADRLNQLYSVEWDKKQEIIPCFIYVIQLVVKNLISILKIKVYNKSIPTSFNKDDINMMKDVLIFKNIFYKISF